MSKTCTMCGGPGPFRLLKNGGRRRRGYENLHSRKDRYSERCDACHEAVRCLSAMRKTQEGQRAQQKKWDLKRKYGLTVEEYEDMLCRQAGLCAVCLEPMNPWLTGQRVPKTNMVCVDHCHETGKVRALLHGRCNAGLGYFKHAAELLRAAASYLEMF